MRTAFSNLGDSPVLPFAARRLMIRLRIVELRYAKTTIAIASPITAAITANADLELRSAPNCGVLCWRHKSVSVDDIKRHLPDDVMVSSTTINGEPWLRSVAANPNANPAKVVAGVIRAAERAQR